MRKLEKYFDKEYIVSLSNANWIQQAIECYKKEERQGRDFSETKFKYIDQIEFDEKELQKICLNKFEKIEAYEICDYLMKKFVKN